MGEHDWITRFIADAAPGVYLRVIQPGPVAADDAVELTHDPDHEVTVGLAFRALTTERELLPLLGTADALPDRDRRKALRAAQRGLRQRRSP